LNDDPFHDSEVGNLYSGLSETNLPSIPSYREIVTEYDTGIILRLARASFSSNE